jgi:hypothetical protein
MPTFQVLMITGWLNLIFFILILLSCRCIGFWRITRKVVGNRVFQGIYSKHCWYWYGFILSVLIHAVTSVMLFGLGF